MIKHLLLSLALLTCAPALPQPGFIELQPVYGMTQANASQSLTQAGLTEAQAQEKFKRYWARWQAEGKTISTFMQLNFGVCCANDAFWVGHMHAITGNPAGSGNIQVGPIKGMMVNERIYWPFGRFEGVGTFGDARYNTSLTLDVLGWKGDPLQRNMITSPSYGVNGAMGYHESAQATQLRLYGNKQVIGCDPSFASSGLVCWDLGESSKVGLIKADFFNDYGVLCERGTPAHFENISAFCNGRAAMGFAGTALAKIKVELLSGDDNGALFDLFPAHGREAGGNINFEDIKCESSTTAEGGFGSKHGYTGQPVGKMRGQFNVTIGNMSYASTWTTSGQLFWIDDRLTNGQPQASRLFIAGAKGFGYAALLVDSRRGVYYSAPPDFSAWTAFYDCSTGVLFVNGVQQIPKPCLPNMGPMGFIRQGQSFNWLQGTPQQQITGTAPPQPTPVTCTGWTAGTWSTWSACVTGSQARTRTVTATPTGCTTTPPGAKPADTETQSCTVTPPPTGSVIATLNNVSVPTVSTSTPVNWINAKSIEFTGLKATGSLGGHLCVAAGRGLKVGTDGSVYISVTGIGNVQCVPPIPAGTVKLNTAVTFTANFPDPITFTRLGTIQGTGAGQAYTCTKMIVKQ